MNRVKKVVGAKDHTIAKNSPKLIVHHNVIKEDALDQIPENVVTCFVLVDALDQNKVIVWYVLQVEIYFFLFFFCLLIDN